MYSTVPLIGIRMSLYIVVSAYSIRGQLLLGSKYSQ